MMTSNRFLSILLAGLCFQVSAWGQPEKTPGAPLKAPAQNADFDIREHRTEVDERAATRSAERRKSEIESSRRLAAGGEDYRIGWNRHGFPQSLSRDGQPLARAAGKNALEAAKDFLRSHRMLIPFLPSEIDNLRQTGKTEIDGVTVLDLEQTVDGIGVFRGDVKITLNAAGEIVHAGIGEVIPGLELDGDPRLTAEDAVVAAIQSLKLRAPRVLTPAAGRQEGKQVFVNPFGAQWSDIVVAPTIFPLSPTSGRLAWRMLLEVDGRRWYEMLVDAVDGAILFRKNLYRRATGRVWKQSPIHGPREVVTFPDSWLGTSAVTAGNNVDAYLDSNGDNIPDPAVVAGLMQGRASSATQVFDFSAGEGTTGMDPRGFQAASVTNLFYYVNAAHDYYYALGFTEANGNFQTNNFGRGGQGGDAVRAEAQDADAEDNAFFATPPEGTPPRMELGITTLGTDVRTDDRDSDFDGMTIIHEYAHGVSQRLAGGANAASCFSGIQSSALGEGWSDYFAISFYGNPVFDAYDAADTVRGLRRRSYEGYPFTYEDLGNDGYEEHNDGEIWTATLWDLRKSLGAALTDRLVVSAIRSTSCSATMVDARDAILTADQAANNNANRAAIWQVFARHGMGFSASGTEALGRGPLYNAAFDRPPDLQPGNRSPNVTSAPPAAAMAAPYTYQVVAADPEGGPLRFDLTQGPAGMTIDPATGALLWTPGFFSERVKVTITDGQGARIVHGFQLRVRTPLTPGQPRTISGGRDSLGIATVEVAAGTPVLQVTLRGGTGDADFVLTDPRGVVFGISDRNGTTETISVSGPMPGTWLVAVLGFASYSNVTLAAALPVPTLLAGNAMLTGLSGDATSETFYRVIVPAGASSLRITTTGMADIDLFTRFNRVPICQSFVDALAEWCAYDQTSARIATGNESILIGNAFAGDWFIAIAAFQPYSGITMRVELTAPPTVASSQPALAFAGEPSAALPAQTITILDTSGGAFTWTAAATTVSGVPWLRLNVNGGTGTGPLIVSAVTTGLAAGTHRGTIVITAATLAGSPLQIPVTLTLVARALLAVSSQTLQFNATRGQDATPQSITISNAGGGTLNWTAVAATSSGGTWLAVEPASGTGTVTVRVLARAAALGDGTYAGTITVSSLEATNSPIVIRVTLTVALPVILTSADVRNLATLTSGAAVSGGLIVSLFGRNFTTPCSLAAGAMTPCPQSPGLPLRTQLGQTRVLVNGNPAPLFVVTENQINLQLPYGLAGSEVTLVVVRGGVSSPPVRVPRAEQSPGVLTVLSNGGGAGIVVHADGRLVTRDAPIEPSEIVVIFLVGLGPVSPAVNAGEPAPISPSAVTTIPLRIFIDGGEGRILFSGLAGGFAGLYQMNVEAPAFLPRKYPVIVVQSDLASTNEATAGGPTLLDITPAEARPGADVTVTLRGVNLPRSSVLRIGAMTVPAALADGPLQSLSATIPVPAAAAGGELSIRVADGGNPQEEASNPVVLRVR